MRRYDVAKSLFVRALDVPAAERGAFVEREAGADAELRREVEELLAFHDEEQGGGFDELPAQDAAPEWVGPWRIEGELGRGGIGVVYLARRGDGPPVALKLLRGGLLSRELVARFRREATVLARLDHPGIARSIETGVDEGPHGPRPWLAMERVEGVDLRTWASAPRSLPERLELMARVCDAVEHAHAHGVVHRDLKPENILVRSDGQPVVLDFGVARLVDSDVRATTLHTTVGVLVGTIRYMSPEQADARPDGIGPRSDVHQLAALTYELMTGRLPYDVPEHSVHRALVAVLTAPPRPMHELPAKLRRPLERVLRAALAKDPAHRLASAALLGADLRRIGTGRAPLAHERRTGAARWLVAGRTGMALASGGFTLLWLAGAIGPPPSPLDYATGALAPGHQFRRVMTGADSAVVRLHFNTRTLPRLREARAYLGRSLALLRTVERRPWHDEVRAYLRFRLGEAEYLVAERTYDADLYERAAETWYSARELPQPARRVAIPDTIGIAATRVLDPLRTEPWTAAAMALDDLARLRDPEAVHERALAVRREGLGVFRPRASLATLLTEAPPPTSDARFVLAGWLQGFGASLARLGFDRGDTAQVRSGIPYLQRAVSMLDAWSDGSGFASAEHDLGAAFLSEAVLTGESAPLDSAIARLTEARRLRADLPGYTSVVHSSRELARAHRLAAWQAADSAGRARRLALALADLEEPGARDVVLSPADRALLALGRAEVFVDLACTERDSSRLGQAARSLAQAERQLPFAGAPVFAAQADLQRVRIASLRYALTGAQGDIVRARQVIDRIQMNPQGRSPRTSRLATLCSGGLNEGPPRRYDLRYPLTEPF